MEFERKRKGRRKDVQDKQGKEQKQIRRNNKKLNCRKWKQQINTKDIEEETQVINEKKKKKTKTKQKRERKTKTQIKKN